MDVWIRRPACGPRPVDLRARPRTPPASHGLEGSGVYVQRHNRSDDLFMFLKKQVGGLRPNTAYAVSVSLDLATNVPTATFGIGGSPGESVFVKAGASTVEPAVEEDRNRYLRMNIDKGNQANGGQDMVVLGNVANGEVLNREYRIIRDPDRPHRANSPAEWLPVRWSGLRGMPAAVPVRRRVIGVGTNGATAPAGGFIAAGPRPAAE